MKTIIKGAIYKDGDKLVRPIFSGGFYVVECYEYKTERNIKNDYTFDIATTFMNDGTILTFGNKVYYECEVNPINTDNFELLSDLSAMEQYGYDYDYATNF